jgi:hypothetical protein
LNNQAMDRSSQSIYFMTFSSQAIRTKGTVIERFDQTRTDKRILLKRLFLLFSKFSSYPILLIYTLLV